MSTESPHSLPRPKESESSQRILEQSPFSAIGANANDNLIQLMFGLEIFDSDTMQEVIMEEVRLVMTP